jgi:dTMP kinase
MFFVFEGADGVGKTTQIKLLARHLREKLGCQVLPLREPGGTPLGERVREVLLDPSSGEINVQTEMFLFMAARAHLALERIAPALEEGKVVLCDRYLWSSVVYQGMVGGLGAQQVLRIGRLSASVKPTRTFIIDLPSELAFKRLGRRDRMESRGEHYQEQVRRAFLELAKRYPQKVAVIDGRGTPEEVHRRILDRLPERGWSACSR